EQSAPLNFLVFCGSGTGEVTIGCMATGFTPASLTFKWEFGGSELANAVQYPTAKKDNRYTGVSQIRVTRQDWDTRKPFTCSAVHADLSILISEIEGSQMVSFGCFAADFSPKDYTITWLRNGKKIDPSESSTSSEGKKNETGTFYNAASYIQVKENHWKDDGTNITCRFANSKEVPPSVYLLPPVDDLSCTNMTLTCFVKDFYPADILVHWLVDNLTIDGNALYSHKTTNVIENGDLFSTYGQLTFSSDGWKDGRVFRCEVYHMSMDSKNQPICFINAPLSRPAFLVLTESQWSNAVDGQQDSMQSTLNTFIILFLITLVYSIGTTAIKVQRCFGHYTNYSGTFISQPSYL
uniref:Ig-like domain-containing protein n=1 Tax=Gadus morhua TaxID=8049 RepID=A0A8C5ASY6_GADMO